jgi:hypothetical protein
MLRIEAATFLQVEVANYVFYVQDGSDQTFWPTQAHRRSAERSPPAPSSCVCTRAVEPDAGI